MPSKLDAASSAVDSLPATCPGQRTGQLNPGPSSRAGVQWTGPRLPPIATPDSYMRKTSQCAAMALHGTATRLLAGVAADDSGAVLGLELCLTLVSRDREGAALGHKGAREGAVCCGSGSGCASYRYYCGHGRERGRRTYGFGSVRHQVRRVRYARTGKVVVGVNERSSGGDGSAWGA